MLGTNGGGFFNANAAHPFENPTPLSNLIQILSIFAIPAALTYYLGRMVKNQGHGWTVWTVMFVMFLGGALVCWWAEKRKIRGCTMWELPLSETWREKKRASAFLSPRSSPPLPPTLHAVQLTRCMIPLRLWEVLFLCSTFKQVK